MATVTHIKQENTNQGLGYKVLTWAGISQANPTGDYADATGWVIASVDWEGTPGATPVFDINPSNNTSSGAITSGGTITQFHATAVGWIGCGNNTIAACKIRPVLTSGGDGTTNITCYVHLVRY